MLSAVSARWIHPHEIYAVYPQGDVIQVIDSTGRVVQEAGVFSVAVDHRGVVLSGEGRTYIGMEKMNGEAYLAKQLDPQKAIRKYQAVTQFLEWLNKDEEACFKSFGTVLWRSGCGRYLAGRHSQSGQLILVSIHSLSNSAQDDDVELPLERMGCNVCYILQSLEGVQLLRHADKKRGKVEAVFFEVLRSSRNHSASASSPAPLRIDEESVRVNRRNELSQKMPKENPLWKEEGSRQASLVPLRLLSFQERLMMFQSIYQWFGQMPVGQRRASLVMGLILCRRDSTHVSLEFIRPEGNAFCVQIVIAIDGTANAIDDRNPLKRVDLLTEPDCEALKLLDAVTLRPGAMRLMGMETDVQPCSSLELLASCLLNPVANLSRSPASSSPGVIDEFKRGMNLFLGKVSDSLSPDPASNSSSLVASASNFLTGVVSTVSSMTGFRAPDVSPNRGDSPGPVSAAISQPRRSIYLFSVDDIPSLIRNVIENTDNIGDPWRAQYGADFGKTMILFPNDAGRYSTEYTTAFVNKTIGRNDACYVFGMRAHAQALTVQLYEVSSGKLEGAMVRFSRDCPTFTVYVVPQDPFSTAFCRRLGWERATCLQVLLGSEQRVQLFKVESTHSEEVQWSADVQREVEKLVAHYLSKLWHMQSLLHHPDTFSAPELHLMEPSSDQSLIGQMAGWIRERRSQLQIRK